MGEARFDPFALTVAAKVPDHLLPWGKGKPYNACRWKGNAFLFHVCMAGLHVVDGPAPGFGGYTVMDDSVRETSRHLQAVRRARGRVLKTGLGMGCFVRMCLTKPEVEHIDVIEINPDIAEHFGRDFSDDPRVTIHVADALEFPIEPDAQWDLIWHDIYDSRGDGGDAELQRLHAQLIARFAPHCRTQGAWQLPRTARAMVKRRFPGAVL